MNVSEILRRKGKDVHKIGPDAYLSDVVQALVDHNCGSLLVCEGEAIVGIITERDILRACAADQDVLTKIPVSQWMTAELVTATPNESISRIMSLMTERRIRHLPIVEDDQLCGMISIGDVVKVQTAELAMENEYLKTYIQS